MYSLYVLFNDHTRTTHTSFYFMLTRHQVMKSLKLLALPWNANILVHEPPGSVRVNTAKYFNVKDNIGTRWHVQATARSAHLLVAISQGAWNVQISTRLLSHLLCSDRNTFDRIDSGLQFKDCVSLWPSIIFSSVVMKIKERRRTSKYWNNLDEANVRVVITSHTSCAVARKISKYDTCSCRFNRLCPPFHAIYYSSQIESSSQDAIRLDAHIPARNTAIMK